MSKWYKSFDKNKMQVFVKVPNPDEESEDEYVLKALPVKMAVCNRCDGRGCYVNPSIDTGITQEEFDDDPDFKEGYFSGRYDVQCEECVGNNVVPEPDEDKINSSKEYSETYYVLVHLEKENYAYEKLCEAERRMGA